MIPLFEKCGKIWDLRLMMDPMTGLNRGYAFVTFVDRESAHEAVRQVSNLLKMKSVRGAPTKKILYNTVKPYCIGPWSAWLMKALQIIFFTT